jgi:hypothetical protein
MTLITGEPQPQEGRLLLHEENIIKPTANRKKHRMFIITVILGSQAKL